MTGMLWLARLLPAAGLILLCITLVLGNARAQTTPAVPSIDSVTWGDRTLTVTWTAPVDETGITAYDVRHIETSEDETDDDKWTVVDDAWTSGVLAYIISDLKNGTRYDVQVRAVNSNSDGAWSSTETGTPALPAPSISSVRGDDRALLVSWSALTGITSKVLAYDVRYIETSSDETVDSNWTVEEDAWEEGGGSLSYAITVLTNDTGYDVQVRGVDENGVDGAWSSTTAATPEDHSDTRSISAATAVNVNGDRVWGAIDSTDDEDYFLLNLPTAGTNYWIYAQGNVDTVGVLMNANGETIESSDYGGVLPNPDNFFIWSKLQHLTYYIKVTGYGDADEPYLLRVRAFPERTGWPTADPLPINGSASGTIDPEYDTDFFKIQLSQTTEVAIRASGLPDTFGNLYNSWSQLVASNDDGYLPGGRRNFLMRGSLPAGTYYLNVSSWNDRSDGPFSVYLTAITEPGGTKADAQALTLGVAAGGTIDPEGDEDYYSLTLDERTHVIVGGVSVETDISAELKDSNDLDAPVDSIHFDDRFYFHRFYFQGTLDAGTYYLKVSGEEDTDTGRYTVRAIREGSYTYFENRCSGFSRDSGINDPFYGCQWHLKNNDQFRNSAGQDIGVEEVWPIYTGNGINVAVVDDGMHYTHEDLKDNVDASLNHNYISGDTDIYDYFEWHGTAVVGLIAAKDNSLGVRGVAPEATIYGYNYLLETGDANRADAMSRNAAVTAVSNNSWGPRDFGEPNPIAATWEMAVTDGVNNGYGGKGVVYVWSAGNGAQSDDNSNLDEIANYYAVTAVCAVGYDDKRSAYSEPGANLWVCGPSSSGRTGQPTITTTDNGHRYFGRMGGTSASAPIVSGVVALVREANNALTWRDVKLILAASARQNDADNTGWEQGTLEYGSTTDRYNFNHEYGFGMVDAKAATDLAVGWTNVPTFRQITTESGTINLSLPDALAVLDEPVIPRQVSTTLTVGSFVDFIEFVEVNTHFSHTSFRDLKVELISPSGAVSLLVPYADLGERVSLSSAFRFGTARHLGENAAGTWTLRITDFKRQSGRAESLGSWGLTIYGHGFKPGAPDIDNITPGPGTLAVEWKVPTDAGKTAITSYDLRYIRKDATDKSDANWTEDTNVGSLSNRSYTITGLSGNVEYEIQLRARNSEGIGVWSGATTAEPTIGKPSAPSITNVTRGDRTLGVAWDAPSDNGGGTITAYDVRYIETSADETVDANWTVRDNAWRSGDLRYVIRNLTNATQYDVQVRAVNSAGDGDWSATETGTPLPDDIPIQMQWEETTLDVEEDVGNVVLTAVFTTTLNAPPEADFEFDIVITTTDLQATKDRDYLPPPSSASFASSDFSQTVVNENQRYQATRDFTVAIIDDTTDESVEDFRVTMNYETSGLQHLQGGPKSATITIRDNEHVPVTLSWEQSDITVDEDDGSARLRAHAVTTVDKQPEDGFTFDASIYTSNGSAVQPGDYAEVDDMVTFDRNDFSRVTVNGQRRYRAAKQVTVNVVDDTVDEIEEDFTVTVEYSGPSPPHLQGGAATATVRIADNEYVPVTIGWRETAITADEDGGSVTLYAQSTTTEGGTPLSDLTFDVRVTTRSGSARQNSDYTHLDATVTFEQTDFSSEFLDGELRHRAEKQITVDILDDILRENNENFTVRMAYSNSNLPFLQGSAATATITISDDENRKPVISTRRPPSTYRENGTSALYTFRASDPQEGPITWSLEGTDQGVFVITVDSSGRGVLTLSSPPDFENPQDDDRNNDYELTVVATDEDGHSDRVSFTITVTDVNEGPEITRVGNPPGSVPENQPQDTVLARYTAIDPENPAAQITRWSTSRTDGGDFVINEQGELRFRNIPDYERAVDSNRDNVYVFSVRAYDGRVYGYFDETVTVTPVNEPPTVTTTSTSATNLRQPENRTSRLYTYRATDPEGAGTVTWSVDGVDGRFFVIDERGQFSFSETSPPDYEQPGDSGRDNIYNVAIQASDDDSNTAPLDVTITVSDVNEGPEVTGGGNSFSVQENRDWQGAAFTGFDPEGGSVTRWALGGRDGGDFTITETGVMTFRSVPDYERPADSNRDNVYEVEVRPYDGRYYGSHPVTVTVEDVNEITGPATLNRAENFEGTLGGYLAGGRGDLTVEPNWGLSGTDGGDFTIDENGQLTFRSVPDYERPVDSNRDNTYRFTVRATDDRYYGTLDVMVTVEAVNEPPTITTTTTSATALKQSENRTSRLYTYRATDPEGANTITWSVAGVDRDFFTVDERGRFSFSETSPPDYEQPGDSGRDNVYNVVIQATDDDSNTAPLDVTITVTDVNEGPEVTGGSNSFSVQENRDWQGAAFTGFDPEGGSVTRWALGGRDGGDFTITETGVMTFRSVPDYERPADSNRDNVYEVEVRPYDGRYYGSHPVTVTVEDVNEITGPATLNRAENFEGTLGGYLAGGRGDLTVEPNWGLSGTDGGDFTIDENGQLTFRSVPDYERPVDSNRDNTYRFTVRATDDRYYGTLDVMVTVEAVNEPPTITTTTTSATALKQSENRTSRLYTYRATDPEGANTITWSVAGVDRDFFTVDERGRFSFSETSPPDYEQPGDSGRDNVYNVVIQATDDDSNTAPLDVTITVTDVNEGPEVTGPPSFIIQENLWLPTAVYTALDPEGANVARWNVGGRDGGDFFITQGGTLYFRNVPDYERPADSNRDNVYEVLIQPYDGRNTGSYAVTITVTDVNEEPEFRSGSRTSFTQPENRTSRLYSFSATDPEGSTVTWSVAGTDGSHFTIDERGQFSFDVNDPPDFDTPADQGGDNIYNATIQARDPEDNTASLPVTVVVMEVNEGPVISRQGSAPGSVPENIDQSPVLARYTASDPERPSLRITQWSTAGRDGGDFVINALGELRFRNSPDYEQPADSNRDNVYEVTIRASDGRYPSTLDEVQIVTVTDVNEAPTITTTSRTAFTMRENGTSTLHTFRATDPEGGTITWTPTGTDGSAFTMDDRGALSFANPPDFDSPGDSGSDNLYNVTVQARDPQGNPDTLAVTVTVTDHNEGVEPTISTRRPPSTYRENGTSTVYTFRASDPQRGPITWSLTGTDGGAFTITPDSSGRGVLTFNDAPDFESPTDSNQDNVYELAVVATDDESHSDRVDFTITVTDHDEGVEPTISTRRPPSTYRENDTRTIYTFRASDPQRGPIAWTLTGVDAGDFTIASDSSGRGVLTFNSPPDFESPTDSNQDNAYELAVVATDEEGHTDSVALLITVTDVNEGPVISLERPATTSVPENYVETGVLADYTASDPENPSASIFRWSTSGRDGGDFVINELGELRFRHSPDHERSADSNRDNVYELMVRAYDGRTYGTLEEPLLITVTEVNEAPVITTKSRTAFSLRETSTSNIYSYRATDQDIGDVVSWSVEGPDAGDFAIFDGVLNFRVLPDFEIPADADEDNVYEITVVAADTGGLRDTVAAVITITDQSEGPVIAGPAFHTVAENYDIAQVLGSYTATDAKDNRTVHPQWSLSGRDGGDFVIDRYSGALTFRNTPDYDRPVDSNRDNIYEFTIRAHDSRAYGYLDVTVTVTPVNEGAPVVRGRTSHSVRENTSTVIYTYRATDPDLNDNIAWSPGGSDGHLFQVSDRGELSFRAGPDFETPLDTGRDNVYELEVVATDGEGLRGTLEVTVTVTAINEGPEVSGTADYTVNENQTLTGATYTARDPEAVGRVTTTITWSASGRDGGDFTIDRETGVLTFRTLPDHERPADSNRDNVYEFTVRAHDGRNYGHFDVTVMVEDVNEITGSATLSRPENSQGVLETYSPAGRGVLDVEPEWRLTGTDSGDFTIGRETGELSFRNLPDHERPADSNRDNVYSFVVQVADGSYYETLEVSVTVTPESEPPAITGRDSLIFRENTPATTRLYTYRATDPEGDAFTWDLGGLDASDFTITVDSSGRGVLTFAASPDFDRPAGSGSDANQYLVTIQARDVQGDTGELPVTVTVTDQNEGATVTGENSIAVVENRDPTIVLARYSAVDPEGEPITRWSLSGSDGGDFLINENGELSFRNTPDYDRPADSNRDNEYLVTVRAYDGRTYGNLDVTITVSNVNEHAPVIRSGSRTTHTYREEGTSVLYTYNATDGDKDDVITWTARGTDGRFFEFNDRNGLVFSEPPDYEDPRDSGGNNEYELTVVATDTRGLAATLDATVTVIAVQEGPEITGTTTHTVTENQDLADATFIARDPEDPDAEVSSWSLAGSDAGDFTITDTSQQTGQNSAELTFRNPPDYDNPADSNRDNEYLVTIRAYNGSTYGSLDVVVTVTDLNESDPVVSGRDTLSFRENTPITTRLYKYSARDDDRDTTFTWSVRGADGDACTINDQGELHFSSPPGHEQPADSNSDNVYEIVVLASDGRNEGTLDVSITVTDVNEGPIIRDTGDNTAITVSENHEAVLFTYTASDPEDPTAEITRWSTSERDGGNFTVNESGELSFRNPPDFERPADSDQNNEYQFTVRASDGQVYGTYDVTVTVVDVNEAPDFRSGSRTSFSYRENGTSTLYTYRAADPEGSDVEWSLRGDDASDFVISESGVLSFAHPPNFDSPAGSGTDGNEYLLTVVAIDDGTYGAEGQFTGARLDGTLDVTVTVTGLNEGPAVTDTGDNTAFTVSENHEAVLFIYAASDPEGEAISGWSTSGRDGGDFTISESGELTFRNPPNFEGPADSNRDNVYEMTVRASDGRYYGTLDVTVTVQAVDESPEFRSGSQDSFVYKENGTSAIYTYRATDPEGADVSWGWSGADSSAFIVSESGVLSFVNPPDYESPTDSDSDNVYELTVEASDEQPSTTRLEVTVTVTNLTDARASIQGTVRVGRTLTADTSGIPGKGSQDGPAFSYQWMADDKDIEGATRSTYEVADDDKGKSLKVKVTFTGDEGNEETVTSAPTEAVAGKSNNAATGALAITGIAQVGQTLTGDTSGVSDADGLEKATFSYQWMADDSDIAGATGNTYTLAGADEGKAIRVRVAFTDDEGYEEVLTSDATEAVAAAPNNPATGAPAISGTAHVDETLTADTSGIADDDGLTNAAFSYQWLADGAEIQGATGSTYTPDSHDMGKAIRVRVSFTDDAGNAETLTSEATGTVTILIWLGTLTAGSSGTMSGYSLPQGTGTLLPSEFSVGVAEFTVRMVLAGDDGALTLGLDGQLSAPFTLHVETAPFAQQDAASTPSEDGTGYTYRWDQAALDWSTGQSLSLRMTTPERPLTAVFEATSESHDGSADFTFELRFSEEFSLSYGILRDHAFAVTGGSIQKAERMNSPSNIHWRITVSPDSEGSVTIVLPVTEDCANEGAVCTEDGRMLANRVELTVTGPDG